MRRVATRYISNTRLLIAATTPIVLLAQAFDASYHALVLLVVACCGVGGAAGLSFFIAALARFSGRGRPIVGLVLLAVFAVVGAQMSWTLRPYLVRPRTPETPFVRSIEGSFLDAVVRTADSARGVYYRTSAPLPGEEEDVGEAKEADPGPAPMSLPSGPWEPAP